MSRLPPGVDFTEIDIYGQRHPIENEELIGTKLKEFDSEVDQLPEDEKPCLMEAQSKCPELLIDDFKLMFLRCEIFNADLAAKRYANYWEQRVKVFGREKAFQPLTLDGPLKDDDVALKIGFLNWTGAYDPSGRAVMFGDPSKQDKSKYEPESMCRALWYILHAALKSPDTQKKGVVVIVWPHHVKFGQLDRKLLKLNSDSIKACIPVRMSAIHVCHPPKIFELIFPVIKMFMGDRLRKRFQIHGGSEEDVLKDLEKYGLTKDMLPKQVGGNVEIDMTKWCEECRKDGK